MPADLRDALREACDLAEMAGLKSRDAERIAELRSLAARVTTLDQILPLLREWSDAREVAACAVTDGAAADRRLSTACDALAAALRSTTGAP